MSLPRLSVPPPHRAALEWLSTASDDAFRAAQEVLGDFPATIGRADVANALSSSAKLDQTTAQELLDALLALHMTSLHLGWELHDTAASVARSDVLTVEESDRQSLRERLAELLVARAVRPLSKASSLARAHSRMFHSGTVIVDLRPVFDISPTDDPLAGILSPVLHMEYWNEEGNLSTASYSLDLSDVEELKRACERALEKAHTLSSVLERAGMLIVDSSDLGYDH